MRIANGSAVLAACVLLLSAAAGPASAEEHSGFLGDYSKLEKVEDALGVKRKIWVDAKFTGVNYQKILVEPVIFFPEPKPTEDVPEGVLKEILAYLDATLRKSIGAELPLVDAQGPGVVRLRMAITAVDVKKGLKPWELLPTAMVMAGTKEATGRRKHDVEMFVESEMTDSVTHEKLALVVRQVKGVELKGKDPLKLEDVQPQIDAWGEALRQEIVRRVKT